MEHYLNSFDGTKIYYNYFSGNKEPTLVFLHGVGANWTVWSKEIEFFQKEGFSTMTLDLRGHGMSEAPESKEKYKLPYFSKDVHAILKKEKITNFVLIGHSLGGAIALYYCQLYSRDLPSSLILVETSCTYPFKHNHLFTYGIYLTRFLRFVANHPLFRRNKNLREIDLTKKGIKKEINFVSYLLHFNPLNVVVKTLDNVEKAIYHTQSKINQMIHNLKIPIFIIAGDKDPVVPLKLSRIIKELNHKAELKIMHDSYHRVIIDQSKKVNDTIYDFISRRLKIEAVPKRLL